MRFRPRTLFVVALLCVVAMAVAYFILRPVTLPAYQVKVSPLRQTIVGTGRVIPPARIELASMASGTITRIEVQTGDTVLAGQTLVWLEQQEPAAQLAQAQAQRAQALARLQQQRDLNTPQAQDSVQQAHTTLMQAERTLARQRALQAQGFISPAAVDEAQQQVDLASSRLQSARTGLKSNQHGSDRRVAEANLQAAEAAVLAASARLAQFTVRSPVAGKVLSRVAEPGQTAAPGKTLLILGQQGETRISMQVDEKHLSQLAVGQPARVAADAFAGKPFAAHVSEIAPLVDTQTGTVEVKLAVALAPAFLRADMTVSAEIQVAQRAQTLVLASDAIQGANSSQPWVWRIRAGRTQRQPVTLGLSGVGQVEIVSGLAAGDQVLASTTTLIQAGQRVQPDMLP
jgi:HlyD family secretion protein